MALTGRRAFLLIVGVGLLGPGHRAEAQAPSQPGMLVAGAVTDRVQGQPIPQAIVRFFEPPSGDSLSTELITETLADGDGRFATGALGVGTYRLEIRAPGYQTVDESVSVDGASSIDLRIEMAPELITLEGIVVVSRRSRLLEDNGFYDRRAQGFGRSFTRDEIRDLGYNRTTEILRMVPGVTLRRASTQGSPYVYMRGACRPDLILDGMNLGSDLPVDDIMPANNLEGLEVHGTATLPIQFSGNQCGAVVMWTIDPSVQEAGAPFSWKRIIVPGGLVLGLFLVW